MPGSQAAPSPLPCKVTQRMPRELTVEEIEKIIEDFTAAAARAKRAGFDGMEIHGAHGYLLAEFLSPYTNKRTDVYGGSFENRSRMPKEVIRRVRESVGYDFFVGYRISVCCFYIIKLRDSRRFFQKNLR